jgi:glycosyltransferase involved in cell wall biosynthesis
MPLNPNVNKRILIVCESFSQKASGGKVSRLMHNLLTRSGYDVLIYSMSSDGFDEMDGINFFFNPKKNFLNLSHLIYERESDYFESVLKSTEPSFVYFCSFTYMKPVFFIKSAVKYRCKIIAQPWIFDFFCAQGFNFRSGVRCDECLESGFRRSFTHNCQDYKSLLLQVPSRYKLKSVSKEIDAFLSTCTEMDDILVKYGISKNRIFRLNLPLSRNHLKDCEVYDNGYFMFYGQFKDFKGASIIIDCIEKNPQVKFKIFPFEKIIKEQERLKRFGNVEVHTDIRWDSGLESYLIGSRAVLVPSLWPTSTETVLFEALYYKKPVIAFNVGAHKDILVHKENAYVVESNNSEEYSKAIQEVNSNFELRRDISEGAFRTALNMSDEQRVAETFTDIISLIR